MIAGRKRSSIQRRELPTIVPTPRESTTRSRPNRDSRFRTWRRSNEIESRKLSACETHFATLYRKQLAPCMESVQMAELRQLLYVDVRG